MNDFLTRLLIATAITLAALMLSSSSHAIDAMREPVKSRAAYSISLIVPNDHTGSNIIRTFRNPSL